MPSAGERISSKQVTIKQREFPTREPGERQFKVLGTTATLKQPKEGGPTYVTFQMEPQNLPEGTPAGRAFPMFFLDSTPDDKGQVSYEGPNGCLAFAQALGDELEATWVEQEVVYTEAHKKPEKRGKTETLLVLKAEDVKNFILAHDGQTVTAYEGQKKVGEEEKKQFPERKDQNIIVRWIIPEQQAEAPSGLPARRR